MTVVGVDMSELLALDSIIGASAEVANQQVSVAVRKTALDIEADAKILAPVDTGNLRNSISSTISGAGAGTSAVIGPTADYGIYQELGTSRMAAQPYLGPAFDRRIGGFITAVGRIGESALGGA